MHRPVLLLDGGSYRNDPASHLHNFVSRDGTPPAELRAIARRELEEYRTVEVRDAVVASVAADGDGFVVTPADGSAALRSRRLLLATGMRDTLPDVPGLAGLYGSVVAHCPYCHGHELSGQHVGVLGSGPHASRVAMMVSRIASRITVLRRRRRAATRRPLRGARPRRRHGPSGEGARRVPQLRGCPARPRGRRADEVGGLFVAPAFGQAAPFAAQLGLRPAAVRRGGGRPVRPHQPRRRLGRGRHGAPGVYPMPLASVLSAAASGLVAASTLDQALMALDAGFPQMV